MRKLAIAVVIPAYNQWSFTRACLLSLEKNGPPAISMATVVVDNASVDGTASGLLTEFPHFPVIRLEKNEGFAGGINAGTRELTAFDVIVLLNNDTVVMPGAIEALATRAYDHGIAGALLLYPGPHGLIQHAGMAGRDLTHLYRMQPVRRARGAWVAKEMQFVTGAAMGVRADLWRALGGLDEAFWCGFEDVDLCLRARHQHGARVFYEPAAGFLHYEGQTPGRYDREAVNRRMFYERWDTHLEDDKVRVLDADVVAGEGVQMPAWVEHLVPADPRRPAPAVRGI